MKRNHRTTLLEVVKAVQDFAGDDQEAVATMTRLFGSGRIMLGGELEGYRLAVARSH